ncbi:MAG: HDOD domain-containing protein [Actinomycetota bacterium]|nr:HDOD domain-containing protein [Actinomycetota bacterium]
MDSVDDLLRRMPVRPLVAQRVLESVGDPEVSLAAVATMVSMDPGLSTRLLRLANSSARAGREPTVSVERAVRMLGMQTVRAVVAAGAFPLFRDDVDLGPQGFWGHALGVAAGAATAASVLGESPEEAFTVGLLHDIGTAIQHYSDPGAHAALEAARDPATRIERERASFGADHARLGSEAVARWGFPKPLVDAIRDHHGSPGAVSRLTQAVMIGEAIAARIDDGAPTEPARPLETILGRLRIPNRPEALIRDTERRYERLVSLAETTR